MHNAMLIADELVIKEKRGGQIVWLLLILLVFLIILTPELHAEGTKTWQPDPNSTSNLYITSPTSNTAGVRSFAGYLSQPNMKMYVHIEDPDNEMLYIGFSGSGYQFRIASPTGAIVHGPYSVTGNITSHAMAVAGPNILNAGGYSTANAMFKFDPQGLPSGDYSIEFSSAVSMQWFDITVTTKGASPTEIKGRLWSQAWQVNCGSFTSALKAKFYARDEKGYVTQVNFAEAGIKPYVGQFSFNDTGTGNSGNVAEDRKSVPGAQSGNPVQKVFLNQPDPNVYPLGLDGEVQNLPLKVENPANPTINIDVTQSGRVELVLDFGTTGNYQEAVDKRLFADVNAGLNTIPWDGKRGDGTAVQPRDYPIPVTISYTQGETHFTAYDVEYLDESFVVRTQTTAGLTGPNILFWDDSRISQDPGLPPNQKVNTDVGSVARQPWSTRAYGDVNTINTWWFSYRDYLTATVLMPGDYGDAPNSYGGATHKVLATPTVYLGSVPPDEENQVTTTLDGTGDDSDGIDDEDAFSSLPNIYTADSSYALNVPCVGTAKVAGWVDFNQSGAFEAAERAEADCTAGQAALSWTGLTGLSAGAIYARFRIASDATQIASPTGGASDGEVEDYALSIRENSASGQVTDSTGATVKDVALSIQNASGDAVIGADGQTLSAISDATGNYNFSGIPVGDYFIVMTPPAGYAAMDDGDTSDDGDTVANTSPIDNRIPFSISQTEDDSDNNFVVATITHDAITQCAAGQIADNLIEYHFGQADEGAAFFVAVGDVAHFSNVAKINGRRINALLTIDAINSSAPVGEQVKIIYKPADDAVSIRVENGAAHSIDNNVSYHIDFSYADDGSPASYSFAYSSADIDGGEGQPNEYLRLDNTEIAETMLSASSHLIEVSYANYREYRGIAIQNGEPESTAVAIYTNRSSIHMMVGQRDTGGDAEFRLDFSRNDFTLPFCHGYDFGDAEGYNTTGATAAKHGVIDTLYMGANVDIDAGTQENKTALSDDENGILDTTTQDDENGIKDFAELNDLDTSYSLTVKVTNNTGKPANLIGWIDVDDSGTFDADEASVIGSIPTGTNDGNVSLNWTAVPTDIIAHDSYLRVRLTTDSLSASSVDGTKLDGEVEDYALTIKVGGFPVKGRVYKDSNINGINDATEKGISGLSIVLLDVSNNSCISTKTDGDGNYTFFPVIPGTYQLYEASRETVATPQNCTINTAKDPAGYRSTTANALASFDVIDAEITGKDFGDVQSPTFSPNHSGTVLAGNVIFYTHTFLPKSTGVVNFLASSSTPQTSGWGSVIYEDTNCNGKLDGAEASVPIASNIATLTNTKICLINKVYAPDSVVNGENFSNMIKADFNFNANTLAGSTSMKVSDLTKATVKAMPQGISGLELHKTVQNITQSGVETETQNQAKSGDVLRYRIYYSNTGTGPITDLQVDDIVPEFTLLKVNTMNCDTTPAGLNCSTNATNDPNLNWVFTGVLKAGAKGAVSYQVIID